MPLSPFRELIRRSGAQPPLGTWIMSASPIVAEAIGHTGFDWAVIDMEHSPVDLRELVGMLQAVSGTSLVPIVRVPWNDTVTFKRVLDAGALTLLVPFVQNADEAYRAVAATRYPPAGVRGMAAMGRASRFGTAPDHFKTAGAAVAVILQLETQEAVANLEAIAAVDGVDALFLGPADLSGTMGYPGQLTHPAVMALMADAVRRCKAINMRVGTVGGTPELVAQYRTMGFDFVAIASDLGLMMRACQSAIAALQPPQSGQAQAVKTGIAPAQGY